MFERNKTDLKRKFKITGLNAPRGVAVEDDIIYVVDSDNHRILTFNSDGNLMNKSTGKFKHPRGIAVTSKWIFVCDRDNSRIVILDKGLKSVFAVINKENILNHPHDIACLCCSSQQYELYITNSNGKIIVLKAFLDDNQPAKILNMHIISEAHMGIKFEGKNIRSTDLRSICIVNEHFLYVTEMCNGGRLICLDLKKGGCCVYTLKRKNKRKCRPTIVTHCGNIIVHTESVPKPNRCPGFFLHFFEHTSMYPPHIRFLELTLTT